MNFLKLTCMAALSTAAVSAAPVTAHAAGSSINISITAHVDVFCKITPPSDDRIELVNGEGRIGEVREICNTPSGYLVTTQFSNLERGVLKVAGQSLTVDPQGTAVRYSNEPAVANWSWNLAQAAATNSSEPVIMRVTISPR